MKNVPDAFTRLELAATVAALALVSSLIAPLLGSTRDGSARAGCFNNLRQVGHGVRLWANEHFEQVPWLTLESQGGTRPDGGAMKGGGAWIEYSFLSNQLSTPRILACPADLGVRAASTWTDFAWDPQFRQNALSYHLALHQFVDLPKALLSLDVNLRMNSSGSLCEPVGVGNAELIQYGASVDPTVNWTNAIHGMAGHLLVSDGSVEFTTSERARIAIVEPAASSGSANLHLLRARSTVRHTFISSASGNKGM